MFGIGGKLKDFLGSAANKAADKLVPKELAPFLPMLAPMFMGPGAGIMSRYLMPQLLTALSSGKTAGDISGTGQALAGLGSFLSDPGRMALSEQTKPVASTAGNNQNPFMQDQKLVPRDDFIGIPSDGGMGVPQLEMQTTGRFPNPEYIAPTAGMPSQTIYDISQIDNPTFMDYLKTGVNKSRDFMQGTNVANTISGDEITVGDQSKLIGKPKIDIYDPAYQSAVRDRSALAFDFGKDNALQATGANYRPGNEALVRDAGFMQNLPRRAVMQGLQQIGPASTAIDKFKADQDAEATRLSEEQEAYNNAIAELGRYYGSLADPDERFGSYYNKGGLTSLKPKRVGLNQGGMGDIDMMLLELFGNAMDNPKGPAGDQFAPTESNLVDMLKAGFKVVKKGGYDPIDYNQGGRVNKNIGGILRALAKPAGKAFNKLKTKLSRMTDDVEIYGSSDFADDTGAAFSAHIFPKTKKGLRELNKLSDEGLITREADGGFYLGQETRMEALEELFPYIGKNLKASGAIDDINEFKTIKQLQEGSSGYGPDYGYDEILEYITRGRKANGGRVGLNEGGMGGIMNAGSIPQTTEVPEGMQLDGRGGGFIPMGAQEKQDDVPAMLAKNEFVMTSDAVRAAGGGSIQKGAQRMYDMMNQLEAQV